MEIHQNKPTINFQGAAKILRKRHFTTEKAIINVLTTHPNSNGIVGTLPYGWLKNISQLPKNQKDDIIKNIFKLFRNTFAHKYNKKELVQVSKDFTQMLHNLGVISETNQIIIKKRKVDGAIITGAYTIKERGKNKTLEPLFVKQFYDNTGKFMANKEGIFAEIASGLHLNKISGKNEHILSPYFGDTKAKFMVSKYEMIPQNIKIPRALTLEELYLKPSALKEQFSKLRTLTKDYTNFDKLLAKLGFVHQDLHDQNIVITRNKKGNLILKLIDLGKIVKITNKK